MQSEAGAAGAVHGALQLGSMSTTFTSSQGLLLMIPNMFKIAGELTPFCMHVAARTIATHALSIFGDHSDVMAARQTGFAMLSSFSVQQAHDMALVGHAATLRTRVPFMHFFDGFRTSHEVAKIALLDDSVLRGMIKDEWVAAHRARALSPNHPVIRGTAANPDTFFQAREAANGYYASLPEAVQQEMDKLAALTGRAYKLFEYEGHPQAERVIVIMGSGAETVQEYVDWAMTRDERVGVLKVRLYRPFSVQHFVALCPSVSPSPSWTAARNPALRRATLPGRGRGSVKLTKKAGAPAPGPAPHRRPLRSIEQEFARHGEGRVRRTGQIQRRTFTVGINDGVTGLSLTVDEAFDLNPQRDPLPLSAWAATAVGANRTTSRSSPKAEYGQGYFVADSRKRRHHHQPPALRADPIRSHYLIRTANFIACHRPQFVDVSTCWRSRG